MWPRLPEQHDTVIVGGGQAGLAMSAVLQQHGVEHVVLERQRVGERWRSERWDSLRFQFPNWSLELPGYRYAGPDPDGFASYREVLQIIEDYARSSGAPVREHCEVTGLAVGSGGRGFAVSVAGESLSARRVVIATGPFQRPLIPGLARTVPRSVQQLDPTRYRRPEELPQGAVLVVGSGASGTQIADELLRAGRTVYLSVSRHRRVPRRFRGKDVYWWFETMGRFAQTIDSLPDRRWPPSTLVTGVNGGYDVNIRSLAAAGVRVVGRLVAITDGVVVTARNAEPILHEADQAFDAFVSAARQFATHNLTDLDDEHLDSSPVTAPIPQAPAIHLARADISTIIWATGYTYDFDWVKLPVFDEHGRPQQTRGITRHPGLYFVGLHWMHTFKSGLFSGVGADAEYLASHTAWSA